MTSTNSLNSLFKSHNKLLWVLFCLPIIILALFLSLNSFISHSELWSIAAAKLLGSTQGEATPLYYKSLFYLPLKLLFYFDLGNLQHILWARLLFSFIALLSFFLMTYNIYLITRSQRACVFFALFLLIFQIYFYNFFRVRADTLCLFFILCSYTFINRSYLKRLSIDKTHYWFLFFLTCAFLATPKSFYLIISLIIYRQNLFATFFEKKFLYTLLTLALFLVGFLSIFHLLKNQEFLHQNPYVLALNYHWDSYLNPRNLSDGSHIFISLKLNFINYLAIFMGFIFFFVNKKSQGTVLQKKQWILFFMSLVTLVVHPERWPYFIAGLLPFLSLPILFTYSFLSQKKYGTWYLLFLFLSLIYFPLQISPWQSWYHNNQRQRKAIGQLEQIVKTRPHSTYFDSTGLLPRQNAFMQFLGPNDLASKQYLFQKFTKEKPTFIFYTTKLLQARPQIDIFLHNHYQAIDKNGSEIWVLKEQLDLFQNKSVTFPYNLRKLFVYDYVPIIKY